MPRNHAESDPTAPRPPHGANDEVTARGYVLGMLLFLATLTMLFIASMIGYAIIRVRMASPEAVPEHLSVMPLGSMRPPNLLFLSTAVILASSVTMHYALDKLRQDRPAAARKGLIATLLLAVGFVVVQAPAMTMLLRTHWNYAEGTTWVYGFVFFLILVHALHVLGGLIPMTIITAKAARGAYSAAHTTPVRCLAYYWHFLDGVWIIMFSLFMVLG